MEVREFRVDEPVYQESLDLRDRFLRIPLGLSIHDDDLTDEGGQVHVGLFDGGELVASVILKDLGGGCGKLRQMVVEESRQGRGLGRRLIEGLEDVARSRGFSFIEMAARLTARGFYEALGYVAEGDVFPEVGIDHIRMVKRLGIRGAE
ncbi:MAG: GNAT family N-acetyltransferase [Verrucomicrobiales bacterium]|nr:GNAT family N-acetyltransferase [Verrucomicrobiota bacterium JB025]